ncbi:alcohol dehydrogenase [Rubrivivax gelatinosus]|uniref:iron-containing alcohol dehydrogenase n=1 Tax=Rubrivivax gelatinosus TaxID=28068 RepID=UPI0019040AB5|nr:iron-containing alcohol dehydrogenase [Rubrivivax gelatinosus]MBK1612215.1 alcohol dehydrogenase [Rubrivivax gelatinosus]
MTNLIGDMARTLGLPQLKRAAGVVTKLLPIPQPLLIVGPGASAKLGQAIGDFTHRKVMVVTDATVVHLGLLEPLLAALHAAGTETVLFDRVEPDAPIPIVEAGITLLREEGCDAIVAFGGGSVMDAAKVIGLAVANGKSPQALVGYFKGLHGPLPLYAVPTTAGTGSEVTVAAVISDPAAGRKLVVADTRLVPRMAALDPQLMVGLPPAITAATGMDALTHAVEAYIGQWCTDYTDRMALAAVGMVFEQLERAVHTGSDLVARERMALASTYAGLAFTRANVGNVHAIVHQLGGRYHVPHGLANAIVLPAVLRFCAASCEPRLAALARRARVGAADDGDTTLAHKFIDAVAELNRRVGIPDKLEALRAADIPKLAQAACREADGNYPVPRVMTQRDCEAILRSLLPAPAARKRAAAKPAAKPASKRAPRKKAAAA